MAAPGGHADQTVFTVGRGEKRVGLNAGSAVHCLGAAASHPASLNSVLLLEVTVFRVLRKGCCQS